MSFGSGARTECSITQCLDCPQIQVRQRPGPWVKPSDNDVGKREKKKREREGREGREKKIGAAEGRSGREEVEASSKARRVPDHLPLRKDITLFGSIVPPSPKRLPIVDPCSISTRAWLPRYQNLEVEGTVYKAFWVSVAVFAWRSGPL